MLVSVTGCIVVVYLYLCVPLSCQSLFIWWDTYSYIHATDQCGYLLYVHVFVLPPTTKSNATGISYVLTWSSAVFVEDCLVAVIIIVTQSHWLCWLMMWCHRGPVLPTSLAQSLSGCLQLLEILEISLNLYCPPGNFCVKCRWSTALVSSHDETGYWIAYLRNWLFFLSLPWPPCCAYHVLFYI